LASIQGGIKSALLLLEEDPTPVGTSVITGGGKEGTSSFFDSAVSALVVFLFLSLITEDIFSKKEELKGFD